MAHLDLSPELISAVVGALVALIGARALQKKTKLEEEKVDHEVELTEAATDKTKAESASAWLDTYAKMYQMVAERDADILALRQSVVQLEGKFNEAKELLNQQLQEEKRARKQAEGERDKLKVRLTELEASIESERLDHSRQIAELHARIEDLTKAVELLRGLKE